MRFLLFTLVWLSGIHTYAQSDSSAAKPDERVMFRSKVTQLTSYLNEGNEKVAAVLFRDVVQGMEGFIAQSQAQLDTAKQGKAALQDKRNNQVQLFQQFKSFNGNLIRNRASIHTWADRFIETLY